MNNTKQTKHEETHFYPRRFPVWMPSMDGSNDILNVTTVSR